MDHHRQPTTLHHVGTYARMNWQRPGFAAAYAWLARDLLVNLELILSLLHEPLLRLDLLGQAPRFRGVLLAAPHLADSSWCFRADAADERAFGQMLRQATDEPQRRWLIQQPWMGRMLQGQGLHETGYRILGFAIDRGTGLEPWGNRLGEDDEELVASSDCGWSVNEFKMMFHYRRQPWAIVQDGRIVCRASSGYATPWTEEVLGVWTAPEHRNRGLARHLVAAIVADVLQRKPFATYTTTADNFASQQVARRSGFRQVFTTVEYAP